MVWFKVDDSFYDHPKTEELSDSAIALWTRAGSYCARHLTDGFISHRKADRMCDNPATAITELVDAGLWERESDGYRFHDWHEYQPTREEALAASKAKSVGGAVGNHRRWHVERGRVDPQCPYCADPHRSTDRITDQLTESLPNHPTRPDPTSLPSEDLFGASPEAPPSDDEKPSKKTSSKRASRLPEDFQVTAEMVAWAGKNAPNVDGRLETQKFCNYWHAKSGKDATKLDWIRTWKNWMLTAEERASRFTINAPYRSQTPNSNAPRSIPADETCPKHRGHRAGKCGLCRAEAHGVRQGVGA